MNQEPHPRTAILRESCSGIECAELRHPNHSEFHVTARPRAGESTAEVIRRVAAFCVQRNARIVSMTVFAPRERSELTGTDHPRSNADNQVPAWPLTRLHADPRAAGVIAYGLKDVPLHMLSREAQALGCCYEIAGARFCRLAGVAPPSADDLPAAQATAVFERMESLLGEIGLDFSHVIRTWFYNADILSWYDEFNRARNDFFATRDIRGFAAPASTGIGISNHYGRALAAELLAVAGHQTVKKAAIASPLQCSAADYGSAFSRAFELQTPLSRTLYISGTASISREGRTEFVGDPAGQIHRTLEVVAALLSARGMRWENATRAIAFFKNISDYRHFLTYCDGHGPVCATMLPVVADVCRPDLSFELELEATAQQ